MQNWTIQLAKTLKEKPKDENALGFGHIFTDHMLLVEHDPQKGWLDGRIIPYQNLELDPSAMVLHYGQAIFEGLKAYRRPDGGVQLFRPADNFARMNQSCQRMCIPPIDEQAILQMLLELIRLEKDWVPSAPGTSLYIRPTIIATDPYLGVKASGRYLFYIICSPSGAYYPQGLSPVPIFVEDELVRAVRGGTGHIKAAANYAISLYAGEQAKKRGYTQVLWLDGVERKYVEEVGSMNIFFKIDGELITAPLGGSILPGITRDSVIRMATDMGVKVVQRRLSIDELAQACRQGRVEEVFGTGTAAVISPVGQLCYQEECLEINNGQIGPTASALYDKLTKLQYGLAPDPYGWVVPVA